MHTNNTMQMDVLDILFANRNKTYGAYQLRRNYNKRLSIAIAAMLLVCALFTISYGLGKKEYTATQVISTVEVDLTKVAVKENPVIIPPVVKQIKIEQPVATIKSTSIIIAPDEQVTTPPPTQADMNDVRIDLKTTEGRKEDFTASPVEEGTGKVESLIKTEPSAGEFQTVQKQAMFPGGPDAWIKFLQLNLRSDVPTENGAATGAYTVVVSFLVNKEGNISEVKAESDPGYGTAAEAVRVIERGPS